MEQASAPVGRTGPMTPFRCSVVIPAFGDAESIAPTLRCLSEQTLARDRYEVIVVDNNRDEAASAQLADVAGQFSVRLVRERTPGPAAARNAGIAAATGDVIVFVDDDIQAPPGFLEAHLTAHTREPSVGIGRIIESNNHSAWFLRYLTERRVVNRAPDPEHLDFRSFYGANASVTRAVLIEAGGYDEAFARREDADLGYRLMMNEVAFRYVDGAVVHHHSTFGPRDHLRRSYWNGWYLAKLIQKHPGIAEHENLAMYAPWKRWLGMIAGPPLVVVGALVYPLTARPLFKGITALVLAQNNRGYAAFLAASSGG